VAGLTYLYFDLVETGNVALEKGNFKITSVRLAYNNKNMQRKDFPVTAYTVKKIYRIPVFFFTKPFRNGKTPMLTRDFWCPPEKGFVVF